MHSIVWPEGYIPGYTDNYVSNVMIIKDLSLKAVWENLVNTDSWTKYYSNMADVEFYNTKGTHLDERLDVIHAWLIEELAGNRVRILTQETQNGKPAEQLAKLDQILC